MKTLRQLSRSSILLLIGIAMTSIVLAQTLLLTIPTTFYLPPNHSLKLVDYNGNTVSSYDWGTIQRSQQNVMTHGGSILHKLVYMGDAISVDVTWDYTAPTGVTIDIRQNSQDWAVGTTRTITQSNPELTLEAISLTADDSTMASMDPQAVDINFYVVE